MRSVSDNIALFTRAGLEQRKIADGLAATVAAEYVKGKYDLTTDDVRAMRKAVAHWRGIYEARYRDIRHGVFAHKGLSRSDADLLMAKTNIEEMKTMFGFLHALHLSLWELYFNGRRPDLTPATFVMPPSARHAGGSLKAGERVYRDSLEVLFGMLSPSEADRSDD
ncbi:hypothetical protein [Tardiphaga sp. 813_E8_N1_3]|uniref:hypothetical protein n=1 Tax=Tardiphaga sp. 813_E8_N1_3 TaxID=3240760 RepID=UPI003F2217A3